MGKSVINGEIEIFNPSVLLCFIVCVITSVNNGPGDIPAVNPKKEPMTRNCNESTVIILLPWLIPPLQYIKNGYKLE